VHVDSFLVLNSSSESLGSDDKPNLTIPGWQFILEFLQMIKLFGRNSNFFL